MNSIPKIRLIPQFVSDFNDVDMIVEFSIKHNRNLTLNEISLLSDSVSSSSNPEAILKFYSKMEGLSEGDIFNLTYAMNMAVNKDNVDLLIEFSSYRPLSDSFHFIFINTICEYDKFSNRDTLVKYYKRNKSTLSPTLKKIILKEIRKSTNPDNIIEITSEPEVKNNKDDREKFTDAICKTLNTKEYKETYDDLDKTEAVNKLIKYYKKIDTLSDDEKFIIIHYFIAFAPDKCLIDIIFDHDIKIEWYDMSSIINKLIEHDAMIQIKFLISNYNLLEDFLIANYNFPVDYKKNIIEYILSKPLKEIEYSILVDIYSESASIDLKKIIWDYIVSQDKPEFIIDFMMNVDNSIAFNSNNTKFKSVQEFINYINNNISDENDRLKKIDNIVNGKRLVNKK